MTTPTIRGSYTLQLLDDSQRLDACSLCVVFCGFRSFQHLRFGKCRSSTLEVKKWFGEWFSSTIFHSSLSHFYLAWHMSIFSHLEFNLTSTLPAPPTFHTTCVHLQQWISQFSEKTMVFMFRRGVTPSCSRASHWLLLSLVFFKENLVLRGLTCDCPFSTLFNKYILLKLGCRWWWKFHLVSLYGVNAVSIDSSYQHSNQ